MSDLVAGGAFGAPGGVLSDIGIAPYRSPMPPSVGMAPNNAPLTPAIGTAPAGRETKAPEIWQAPGALPVQAPGVARTPTGGLTMKGQSPDTVMGDPARTPAWQVDSEPPRHDIVGGVPIALESQDPAHQFIDWIGRNEGASWGTLYGNAPGWNGRLTQDGKPIVNGQPWEGAAGPDGRPTHTFGKGQFQPATWVGAVRELNAQGAGIDVTDASPLNQSRVLLHLAQRRDPHFLDKFIAGDTAGLSATLKNEWTSLAKGSGADTVLNLRDAATGPFRGGAVPLIQAWQSDLRRAREGVDEARGEAKGLRDEARAEMRRWREEGNHPPQNMHDAWKQWSGIASMFGLLGGLVGRNHTAALAAAGTMLQAANTADSDAYDKSYGQWKDHLDRGMKFAEYLLQDARSIVDDARKSYDEKVTELQTLSTAHHLQQQLDPASIENLSKNLDVARKQRDLIEAQNEQTETRNSAKAKDDAWLGQHPEAKGVVPPELHNQHIGDAERERKGTTASGQMMQFRMAEAARLKAEGVPEEEANRRAGLIPQLPRQSAGNEESRFIESQVAADKAKATSNGTSFTADDEQASRLRAREDWARSAQAGKAAAGRAATASDRALQWKMDRAKELIENGTPKDEAYRQVGLEPQQRAAGLENQFIQGRVAQAEAEAEANGQSFDRSAAIAAAHEEWARRGAAGRVAAGRPESAKEKAVLQGYNELFDNKRAQYRDAHGGQEPQGDYLAKLRNEALRESGLIHVSSGNPRQMAANAFVEDITAKTGHTPTYEDWVRFSADQKGFQTGQLSQEAVEMLAKQYQMGDPGVITSLPRGGPARIQVENQVAKDLTAMGEDAQKIVMNRMRMVEARTAAQTAGRVTMQTELYSQEAIGAGKLVIDASKAFPRTNIPLVNVALEAAARNTGDPKIINFGVQLNALINAYGKLSNPTGTGIHDADKARISRQIDESLAHGQIEAAVDAVILEGRNVSYAAEQAQREILERLVPRPAGAAAPPPRAMPSGATGTKPPIGNFFQ